MQFSALHHDVADSLANLAYFLKPNDDKTEVIIFGSAQQLKKIELHAVHIGDSLNTLSHNVRNLGVQLDETMTMESHITTVWKSAIFHLHNIARIRHCLIPSATEQIVYAFVTSRLDAGNSLLYRLPFKQIQQHQRVQNWAARFVVSATKLCRATPLLREQHWLPIAVRVEFKILLLVHRALNGRAPDYVANYVRSFGIAAPTLLTVLSEDVFKVQVNTNF